MELAESLVLRCYHLPVYDWTPLSQDPCWRSSVTWLPNVQHKSNLLLHMSIHPVGLSRQLGSSYLEYEVWNPGNTIQMAPSAVSARVTLCHDPLRHSSWLTICSHFFLHFSQNIFSQKGDKIRGFYRCYHAKPVHSGLYVHVTHWLVPCTVGVVGSARSIGSSDANQLFVARFRCPLNVHFFLL